MLLRFLKLLFGLLCGTIFLLTLFIVIPCYFFAFNFFSDKKAPHIAHRISQVWAKIILRVFFIRVKVHGREYIDENKTYVFVANHQSQIDIPIYAVACKNTLRYLAKKELTKIPLLGYVINKLYLSVDRSDKEARYRSMLNLRQSLEEGISVFICPEGTRNRTDKPLVEFKEGAFRLAIEAQVPLAALTLVDSKKLLSPEHGLELSPGTIDIIWDKPIDTTGMTEKDIPVLKERVWGMMSAHLK